MNKKDHYRETHATWDSIAGPYEAMFMDLSIYDHTYAQFCELLPHTNASVLELGCGPGNITRRLLDRCPELEILATDVSQNMIDLAKKNNPTIRTQLLDCRDLSGIDKQFDGIVCGFTIPYLSAEDVSKLITSCQRHLKPGGVLYLSFVPGPYDRSGFISGRSGRRTYFFYHEEATIEAQLRKSLFDPVYREEIHYEKADGSSEKHLVVIAQRNDL